MEQEAGLRAGLTAPLAPWACACGPYLRSMSVWTMSLFCVHRPMSEGLFPWAVGAMLCPENVALSPPRPVLGPGSLGSLAVEPIGIKT